MIFENFIKILENKLITIKPQLPEHLMLISLDLLKF